MQKSRKKKGFTLTELAIVIAVIAILIAVLVPTFVSLINSAKLSADEQATRNMNTALATDEAINGKPSNLVEAQEVLEAAGFSAELIPTTSGCYYYWNSEYNIVMLIDTSGTEWELIYPTTDDAGTAYTQYYSSCYNLNAKGTTAVQDEILTTVEAKGTIKVGATDDYDFDDIVDLANTYGETFEGATIQLTGDITVDDYDPILNFQGTFNGAKADDSGNYTITVSENAIVPVHGSNGNGYLYSDVYDSDGTGSSKQQKYGYGLFASVTNGGVVENITVNYSDTNPTDPGNEYTYFGGIVGMLDGGTISNCTVTGTIIQYNRVGGIVGTALDGTISNCVVTANIQSKAVETSTYYYTDSTGKLVQNTLSNYSYAAGIVAYAGNKSWNSGSLTITGCTVGGDTTITIQSQGSVGGIITWVSKGINPITISDTELRNVTVQKNGDAATQVGAVIGCVGNEVTLNGNVTCTDVTVKGHSTGTNYWSISATGTNVDPGYTSSGSLTSGLYIIGRDAKKLDDGSYTSYIGTDNMKMTVTWTTSS